ncbi:hypothetical protein D6833_13885 [Candidatus Parcubacteria bacterium]|nr:MAG: hypothetical protein D6833_13885 [Candidatus Parcubacteria bacterium]
MSPKQHRLEILNVLHKLALVYPQQEVPEETVEMYVRLLDDLPVDALRAAALQLATTSKWFPTVAEIREAAFALMEHQSGLPSAYEAWQEVMRQAFEVGHTGKPQFSHPAIMEAVKAIGGWRYVCMSTNQVADRARFVDAYEQLVQRARYKERMLPAVKTLAAKLSCQLDQLPKGEDDNE